MRPTRRGYAVVGLGLLGFLLAALFGPRALNAVVLPAFIALTAAAVQLRRLDAPQVRRDPPPDGFPGETGTVRLRFETDDPFVGVVRDEVDDGLTADPAAVETTVGGGPVEYEVTYGRRGQRTFGPVRFVARDVLGLLETDLTVPSRSTVLVYPSVRTLTRAAVDDLGALYDTSRTDERDEFDTLREYERGDPLRDIHWKSTAKREDLIVKQFAADSEAEAVTIAAGASAGNAPTSPTAPDHVADRPVDEMAAATASVAMALLSVGVPVEVLTPDGGVEAAPGSERAVLELLARAGPGRVPVPEADVVVEATARGTTVRIGDVDREFESMAGERRAVEVPVDEEGTARDGSGGGRDGRKSGSRSGTGADTGTGSGDGSDRTEVTV